VKTIGVEIERRQIAVAWVSVPSHWDHDRCVKEIAARIDVIREAADNHLQPLEWGKVYSPNYRASAVIGSYSHADFDPDYCFPDESPPPNPDQIGLEL
jgi:hypothetical protein